MNRPAARLGDMTAHLTQLSGLCAKTVLINGKPAWRIGDVHWCIATNANGAPHCCGITKQGWHWGHGITKIEGQLAACLGDIVEERAAVPPENVILTGEPTVLIGQR